MKVPKILLFIPIYNCEDQIPKVVSQIDKNTLKIVDKVLLINNCSTDNTERNAIDAVKLLENVNVEIVRNKCNYGYGGSLKAAFNYSVKEGYDWIIVLHGDNQGHIENLLPYIKSKEYIKYDCLLGARFHPKSTLDGYSLFRTFGNRVFNIIFSIILGKKIQDLGSGLNMYKVSIFQDEYYLKFPDNLAFDYCGLMSHVHYNRRVKFFPILWTEDGQISNVKILSQAVFSLKLLLKYYFKRDAFFQQELRSDPVEEYTFKTIYSSAK